MRILLRCTLLSLVWWLFLPSSVSKAQSVSCGAPNKGKLYQGVTIPLRGFGFTVPLPWSRRKTNYMTSQLATMLQEAAAAVASEFPDSMLGIADATVQGGGTTGRHKSHQSGRDVDLIFYSLTAKGKPSLPDGYFPWYQKNGVARSVDKRQWKPIPTRYFDLQRNWALVRSLLTSTEGRVQYLFVSRRVEQWLLRYATAKKEPQWLLQEAKKRLHRPSKGDPHNTHMHVRIYCSDRDIALGQCQNQPTFAKNTVRCPASNLTARNR